MATRSRTTNNLPQFVGRVQQKAARSMTQALILGASEAASMTPIDTSTLINSQFRNIDAQAGRVVGTVGYTAEYALAVHEASGRLKGEPRANFGTTSNHSNFGPQKPSAFGGGTGQGVYWGPSGEPQFLKKGFEQAEPNIRAVILGSIKTS